MVKSLLLLLSYVLLSSCVQNETDIISPDGRIECRVCVGKEGDLSYTVNVDGRSLILSSRLGFEEKSGLDLSRGFVIENIEKRQEDEHWTQPWGENKENRSNYSEQIIRLKNTSCTLDLTVRVFDDGVGFRYAYRTDADSLVLTDELTAFRFASEAKTWSIPADYDSYEHLYRTLPLSELRNANTPLTLKTQEGIYASIHEAALVDFPEMTLRKSEDPSGMELISQLAQWPDGAKARFAGGYFVTPWRTVQISRDAVGLINSSLILNLNDPCVLEGELDWIRPMKYVGIWWGMHLGIQSWVMGDRHGATTERMKEYIDFAAENGIQGALAEGWNVGWESWGRPGKVPFNYTQAYADYDIDELSRYAAEKGVHLIGHHETGGDMAAYEANLDTVFRWTKSKGIDLVKTGYAGAVPGGQKRHGQYAVRHYMKVVRAAAEHHIALNVHEPIKPTGIRRTYPNLMSGEGARGMEWNAWSEGNPPEHQTILPFTRLLAGPMDYTPGTFDILFDGTRNHPDRKKWNGNDKGNSRVNTTLAKQLADWVILYSPVQMASDLIENYKGHPAFQFFRDFNPDCDWSRALQGEPGEYIAIVRRAGENFYLGVCTDENARTITLPLDFLEEGVEYEAVIYADGKDAHWKTNPLSYAISHKRVGSSDVLVVEMAPGGGQAVTLTPVVR